MSGLMSGLQELCVFVVESIHEEYNQSRISYSTLMDFHHDFEK